MARKSDTHKGDKYIAVGNNAFFLKKSGAIVEYKEGDKGDTIYGNPKTKKTGGTEIAQWGEDNLLPQQIMKMVYQNHLKPQLLVTEEALHDGMGIDIFKKVIEGATKTVVPWPDDEIRMMVEDRLEEIGWYEIEDNIDANLIHSRNDFTHFILNAEGKIERLVSYDFTDCRCEVMDDGGKVNNILIYGDWEKIKNDDIDTVANYTGPLQLKPDAEFILHTKNHIPGNPYYGAPAWWGTRKWTEVSNEIPIFHHSGLLNGYNIKYHIQIPESYFAEYADDDKALEAAKEKLQDDFDEFLAGGGNNLKSFFSTYREDYNGKPINGWKFDRISSDNQHEAYIKLDTQANINHASGHGVHPGIAGIDTGGKLGGSGSEMRIAIDTFRITKSPKFRKLKYRVLNMIKKIEGWPREMTFGNIDVQLTTLDANPTGRQNVTEQSHGIN